MLVRQEVLLCAQEAMLRVALVACDAAGVLLQDKAEETERGGTAWHQLRQVIAGIVLRLAVVAFATQAGVWNCDLFDLSFWTLSQIEIGCWSGEESGC